MDYTLAFGANYQILENVTLMAEYRKLEQEDANDGNHYETGVNEFIFADIFFNVLSQINNYRHDMLLLALSIYSSSQVRELFVDRI